MLRGCFATGLRTRRPTFRPSRIGLRCTRCCHAGVPRTLYVRSTWTSEVHLVLRAVEGSYRQGSLGTSDVVDGCNGCSLHGSVERGLDRIVSVCPDGEVVVLPTTNHKAVLNGCAVLSTTLTGFLNGLVGLEVPPAGSEDADGFADVQGHLAPPVRNKDCWLGLATCLRCGSIGDGVVAVSPAGEASRDSVSAWSRCSRLSQRSFWIDIAVSCALERDAPPTFGGGSGRGARERRCGECEGCGRALPGDTRRTIKDHPACWVAQCKNPLWVYFS